VIVLQNGLLAHKGGKEVIEKVKKVWFA
jgi:hypothetical protein